ncbi:hypothetical protein HDU97_008576 [Phlyctochytrium planicorne]|nr:hypothetical protein HDU97_008576 [Phlyctochytrium planicorne]
MLHLFALTDIRVSGGYDAPPLGVTKDSTIDFKRNVPYTPKDETMKRTVIKGTTHMTRLIMQSKTLGRWFYAHSEKNLLSNGEGFFITEKLRLPWKFFLLFMQQAMQLKSGTPMPLDPPESLLASFAPSSKFSQSKSSSAKPILIPDLFTFVMEALPSWFDKPSEHTPYEHFVKFMSGRKTNGEQQLASPEWPLTTSQPPVPSAVVSKKKALTAAKSTNIVHIGDGTSEGMMGFIEEVGDVTDEDVIENELLLANGRGRVTRRSALLTSALENSWPAQTQPLAKLSPRKRGRRGMDEAAVVEAPPVPVPAASTKKRKQSEVEEVTSKPSRALRSKKGSGLSDSEASKSNIAEGSARSKDAATARRKSAPVGGKAKGKGTKKVADVEENPGSERSTPVSLDSIGPDYEGADGSNANPPSAASAAEKSLEASKNSDFSEEKEQRSASKNSGVEKEILPEHQRHDDAPNGNGHPGQRNHSSSSSSTSSSLFSESTAANSHFQPSVAESHRQQQQQQQHPHPPFHEVFASSLPYSKPVSGAKLIYGGYQDTPRPIGQHRPSPRMEDRIVKYRSELEGRGWDDYDVEDSADRDLARRRRRTDGWERDGHEKKRRRNYEEDSLSAVANIGGGRFLLEVRGLLHLASGLDATLKQEFLNAASKIPVGSGLREGAMSGYLRSIHEFVGEIAKLDRMLARCLAAVSSRLDAEAYKEMYDPARVDEDFSFGSQSIFRKLFAIPKLPLDAVVISDRQFSTQGEGHQIFLGQSAVRRVLSSIEGSAIIMLDGRALDGFATLADLVAERNGDDDRMKSVCLLGVEGRHDIHIAPFVGLTIFGGTGMIGKLTTVATPCDLDVVVQTIQRYPRKLTKISKMCRSVGGETRGFLDLMRSSFEDFLDRLGNCMEVVAGRKLVEEVKQLHGGQLFNGDFDISTPAKSLHDSR